MTDIAFAALCFNRNSRIRNMDVTRPNSINVGLFGIFRIVICFICNKCNKRKSTNRHGQQNRITLIYIISSSAVTGL